MSAAPKPSRPANRGFPMPDFRGTSVGQVVGNEQRLATGKRFPMDTPDRGTIWIPIKETRFVAYWVWDGARWITAEDWAALHVRTAPAGTKFPSKNDFDFSGAPRVRYARRPVDKKKRK